MHIYVKMFFLIFSCTKSDFAFKLSTYDFKYYNLKMFLFFINYSIYTINL